MKKAILYICSAGLMFTVAACGGSDDTIENQQTKIESYLTTNSLEYYIQGDVYVYVANADREDYDTSREIAAGKNTTYYLTAYTFSSSPASLPFFTNRQDIAEEYLSETDFDYWSFEPITSRAGSGGVMPGVDRALAGLHVGDSVVLYITSNLAYSDKYMFNISPDTALQCILNIEDTE